MMHKYIIFLALIITDIPGLEPAKRIFDIADDCGCYTCVCSECNIRPPVCAQKYLVFTAPDLNKDGQNPDTSFSGVYDNTNLRIQAWRMKPSKEGQQEISLIFGMPNDFNKECPINITFYLLVEKNEGSDGNAANIRMQLDHKGTLQEVGPLFPGVFATDDFTILEPSDNKRLETIIVTKTLTNTGINPQDWVLFVFDRIATIGQATEYDKNIYLSGVVISYGA